MAAPKQKMTFMEKLQHILSTADVELVSWAPNGLSFYVFDADRWVFRNEHPLHSLPLLLSRCPGFPRARRRFSKEILETYNRTANFASFIRQLNYYGTSIFLGRVNFGGGHLLSFHPKR